MPLPYFPGLVYFIVKVSPISFIADEVYKSKPEFSLTMM